MLISENKKWMNVSNTIINLENGVRFDINNAHPIIVCEFFKEHSLYEYKYGSDSTETFSKIKKLIVPLISFDSELVLEYEVRYGMKLITENIKGYSIYTEQLILESWDFVKNKISEKFPITIKYFLNEKEESWWDKTVQNTKKIGSIVVDKIKQATNYVLTQGLPWFFGKLESFLLNPATIAADVALSSLGIGKVVGAVLWGVLGLWKLYQLHTGKIASDVWTYLDIGCCFLGLAFTGAAAKPLKVLLNASRRAKPAILLKSPLIRELAKVVKIGAQGIKSLLLQPIKWLTEKLGAKGVSSWIKSAQDKIDDFIKNLSNALSHSTQVATRAKQIKQVSAGGTNAITQLAQKTTPEIVNAAAKGVIAGAGFGAVTAGIERYGKSRKEAEAEHEKKLKQGITQNSDSIVSGTIGDNQSDLKNAGFDLSGIGSNN